MKKKKKKEEKEVLSSPRPDRRLLSMVPDPDHIRKSLDRRGVKLNNNDSQLNYKSNMNVNSLRYEAEFQVQLFLKNKKRTKMMGTAVDISATGILIEFDSDPLCFIDEENINLKFNIPAGTMPEGFESMVQTECVFIRSFVKEEEGTKKYLVGFEFKKPLTEYFQKKRWGYSVYSASTLLLITVLFVMLMRVESVIYFKYNLLLYLYSLIAATFLLSRYLFGALYRDVAINPMYTPGVTIIIPCFNEEKWISRTILSCINQDYPIEKLEVIVVDDCSTDNSVVQIKSIIERIHNEASRFLTKDRLKMHVLSENAGKRYALVKGVEMANHELVAFVDSDSFLEPDAIKHLVQPFQDPQMGGVAGRTDVENKFTNSITKLQTVRYYIAFRIMKAAESFFDSVSCLSGPLSCYKKELILQHSDAWLNQRFLGHPATFGDDRSMTNYILKTHRTSYQDRAICSTIVPSNFNVFLKQQMRWKRSWLRESLRALTFIWRKEPFMSLFFIIGLIVPIAAPVIFIYNLVYVPIVHHIFPFTFLMGLFLMSLLMSLAHLFFRKSRLWVFGFVFCVFYEFILLWQMPVAWVTFWKSTWGTRDTPQDIEARQKKENKKAQNKMGLPF